MRRLSIIGVVAALLFSGAVVLAATSPTPSASPGASARPSASPTALPTATATPKPSASPTANPSPSPKPATAEQTFSSKVIPLQISGTASLARLSGGAGTLTVHVSGLLDAQTWTIDLDGGTIARPDEAREIAFKAGSDVTRLTMDTVRVHLTGTEMSAFMNTQKAEGVVAIVSDGTRTGYAEFAAG